MAIPIERCRPGHLVWVRGTGWWRRGQVVAALKKNEIVRYVLADGSTKDTRVKATGDLLQPVAFQPPEMIAKAGLW